MLDKELLNEELELWSDLNWSDSDRALNSLELLLSNYGIDASILENRDQEMLFQIEGEMQEPLYLYVIMDEDGHWANVLDSNELDLVQGILG